MRHFAPIRVLLLSILIFFTARGAAAITVDGTLDAAYGSPLSTQTTGTNFGSSDTGLFYYANGSELDEAYAVIDGNTLFLFFTGNLASRLIPRDFPDYGDFARVFIDAGPGGQNTMLDDVAGLKFDADFAPDYEFACEVVHYSLSPPHGYFFAYTVTLPTGGGGTRSALGTTTPGGPGTLTGGTNPYGVQANIDCSNVAGVADGCAASSGAGVTTGIEWAIPLQAIGNPGGCLKISVLITDHDGYELSNQSLAPMPTGICSAAPVNTVDFSALAGDQFFTLCPPTPVRGASWGQLKILYR